MSKIFITSDNHFSHRKIHKFCPKTRPHAEIDEMDRAMIARWQEQVSLEDDVFVLGDVFFCDSQKARNIMNQLPGQKHLIYGNHDEPIRTDIKLQNMFASIQEYKELNNSLGMWIFFHYPIWEWNKIHRGAYHCHGHIHERLADVPGRIANVCVDSPTFGTGDYSLYELETVKRYLDKCPIRTHGTGKDL